MEDLIRAACKAGLTHLTLHPTHSADGKTVYWTAQATPSTMHKYITVRALDPIEALTEVLKALPKAPRRGAKDPTGTVFTAAVTEPDPVPEPEATEQVAALEPENEVDRWLPRA